MPGFCAYNEITEILYFSSSTGIGFFLLPMLSVFLCKILSGATISLIFRKTNFFKHFFVSIFVAV